jgi:hypothetical protein
VLGGEKGTGTKNMGAIVSKCMSYGMISVHEIVMLIAGIPFCSLNLSAI